MPSAVLAAGIATGVGSLPHRDPSQAASAVLRCLPDLAAAPQLPLRSARERMLAQALHGVPGLDVAETGEVLVDASFDANAAYDAHIDAEADGGLLAFVDAVVAMPRRPRRVKAQLTGPLTLGTALARAGVRTGDAFAFAGRAARARARAIESVFREKLPDSSLVLFFDEPALVLWRDDRAPLDRELATDTLSTALASLSCVGGVHVCGAGDLRLALAAGPHVVHVDVDALCMDDSVALSRFVEGGGWVAWGAVPTHGPIGEHPAPLWKNLLNVWCELTRRGCDPVRLRTQALVAPACGLAGHGVTQAEHAMLLARELGNRVHDQAAATRLAVGA